MIELRHFTPEDAEKLCTIANDKRIASNLRNGFPHPYTIGAAREFISFCEKEENLLNQAIIYQGQLAGSIGLSFLQDIYEGTAEIGYWLGPAFWGKGIMTQAVKKMCHIGFQQKGLFRIHAEPFAHNGASRKVLEKAGFQLEAVLKKNAIKNGVVIDSCVYAIWPESL